MTEPIVSGRDAAYVVIFVVCCFGSLMVLAAVEEFVRWRRRRGHHDGARPVSVPEDVQ